MLRRHRHYTRRRAFAVNRTLFSLVAVALVAGTLVLLLDARLRPGIYSAAALQAKTLAVTAIHTAVEQVIDEQALAYTDLVQVSTNAQGNITALSSDIAKMNLLKSGVTRGITQGLAGLQQSRLAIPLGSATGVTLLSGRGPQIPVSLSMTGDTQSDFEHVFQSAGINQTQHKIMLHIQTRVYIYLPGNSSYEQIETSLCVAETIIVGAVPQVMAQLGETPSNTGE